MAKGYLVAHINVRDDEEFERFTALSKHAISEHDCRVLVRNPDPEVKEGSAKGLVIIIEFKSIEAARTFYDSEAYCAAKAVREVCATTDLVLVEGT